MPWKPPSYATPVEKDTSIQDDSWNPPDYAKPVEEPQKEEKPSKLSAIWSAISEPLTEAPTRFAESVSNAINPERTTLGLKGKGSAFIEGVGHAISGLTSPLNLAFAGAGVGEQLAAESLPKVAQALRTGTKVLSAPVAAEGAKTAYEGVKEHDFSKTLQGALEAGMGVLGLKDQPSVRETTEQKPRDFEAKSTEVPYRAGSSTQEPESYKIREEMPIKQADKLKNDEYEFAGNSIDLPEAKPREFSHSKLADLAKEEAKKPIVNPFEKPKAEFLALNEQGEPMYNIVNKDGTRSTFTGSDELVKQGIKVPETPENAVPMKGSEIREKYLRGKELAGEAPELSDTRAKEIAAGQKTTDWVPPDYAKIKEEQPKQPNVIDHPMLNKEGEVGTPESFHPQLTSLTNHGDGVLYMGFDKTGHVRPDDIQSMLENKGYNAKVTELYSNDQMPSRFRIDLEGKDPVHADELGNEIEKSVGGAFDEEKQLSGGIGGIGGGKNNPEPFKGPAGPALDKLFSALTEAKGKVGEQEVINRAERAKRFAAFSSVKDEGATGAAKSLAKLKGEYEKVEPGKNIGLNQQEADSLFTAIKRSNITPGEKARGYTAMFKLLNGESVPQRNELKLLDDVFGNGFADRISELHGGIGAVGLNLAKAANTMKSLENSISLAAPLRHGIGLISRKEFLPAFGDMFKFFGNKEYYNSAMRAIEERPNYQLGRESGLFLAKPGSLMNSEEEFLNSYVGKIPIARDLVGASQRAYTGFLNKLRADVYDSMKTQAEALGHSMYTEVEGEKIPTKESKAIANFINNATGRGSLGPLNKMTNELNTILWSPRMIASRINMLANPKIYTDLPKGMRMEGVKSLLAIAALGTTIDSLAAAGGAKISTNILSSDFGKARFGKDLIDAWGGFQQYIVAAARFLAGKTDSNLPTSRLQIAGKFLASKESPAASLAHSMLTAKKFMGGGKYIDEYNTPTSVQAETAKRFLPIFVQDLMDLNRTEPEFSHNIGLDSALAGASLTGMEQTYPETKPKGSLSVRQPRLR